MALYLPNANVLIHALRKESTEHKSCRRWLADINDVRLAALAIEHRATLVSTDQGFSRFPGLSWVNPCPCAWSIPAMSASIQRFSSRRERPDHAFLSKRLAGAKSYRRIAGYFRSSFPP